MNGVVYYVFVVLLSDVSVKLILLNCYLFHSEKIYCISIDRFHFLYNFPFTSESRN